ncbi:MAG: ATP-grasp domain-containing protein [Promethearchaeota archaeon]
MSDRTRLIIIATQAVGTRENAFFLKAAESEQNIECLICSLDNINLYFGTDINGFEIIIEEHMPRTSNFNTFLDYITDYAKNNLNFGIDSSSENNPRLLLTSKLLIKFNIVMFVRRLGISAPINLGEISSFFGQTVDNNLLNNEEPQNTNFSSYIQQFLARLNKLHYLERIGLRIINSPGVIENCMDKFLSTQVISRSKFKRVRILDTAIISDRNSLMKFYNNHGNDMILKPVFGSRGVGIIRLNDTAFLELIKVIEKHLNSNMTFLAQEFVKESIGAIRLLVYKKKVIAAMDRIPSKKGQWKLNIHRGAKGTELKLGNTVVQDLFDDSIEMAEQLGCQLCGIDILHNKYGYYFLEANSIPGLITIRDYYLGGNKSIFSDIIRDL